MEELTLIEQALDKATLKGSYNLKEATLVGNNFYGIINLFETMKQDDLDKTEKIISLENKLKKKS